jgi:2-succinyl-5-enolpyruvyl-6-hydroxy-3-cyclohexene-1-carboxylate synthase
MLIAGDVDDDAQRDRAIELATAMGWPVISEPSGNLSAHPNALRHGPLVLASPRSRDLQADVVVTVGRVGLHRSVTRLLRDARAHIAVDVPPHLGRVDPAQTAHVIVDAVPLGEGPIDPAWMVAWRQADESAAKAVTDALAPGGGSSGETGLSGPLVARIVGDAARDGDLLVVGPSWPVRHLSSYGGRLRARCLGNRGTSGIDGVVSTGWGAAVAHGDNYPDATTYVLVGDLTAIYDRNGLLAPASEARPRLVYVVVDNGGGGIFSALEQGAPEFERDFERVFGTPLDADIATLLAAPAVDVVSVSTTEDLQDRLATRHDGVRVIVARCVSRAEEAGIVRSVQMAVDRALS